MKFGLLWYICVSPVFQGNFTLLIYKLLMYLFYDHELRILTTWYLCDFIFR